MSDMTNEALQEAVVSADPPRRRSGGGAGRRFRDRSAAHNSGVGHSLHFGPNMTPMVDIVMVILIFFMSVAAFLGSEWFLRAAIPFQSGRGTAVNRPNDPLAPPPTRMEVVLDVDPSGATIVSFLGQSRVSMEQFESQLGGFPKTDATRNIEVLIKPSPKVPYKDVVRAHAACDAAGIFKVGYGIARPQ